MSQACKLCEVREKNIIKLRAQVAMLRDALSPFAHPPWKDGHVLMRMEHIHKAMKSLAATCEEDQ